MSIRRTTAAVAVVAMFTALVGLCASAGYEEAGTVTTAAPPVSEDWVWSGHWMREPEA
ncbi:hypothetical protein ACIBFB_13185 [Nocardiopsis sp. NPDC050513]|uniref:hypothetical protein n=1 Tax=Nocardiopsis sp. NPDC050513 TaxID=3364338 RepID=UPI0037BB454D